MKKFFILAAMALVALTGCKAVIGAVTTFDLKVENVTFEFPAIVTAGDVTRAGEGMQAFSVTKTISTDDIDDADVAKYADVVSKVVIGRAVVDVTPDTDEGEYVVENLTITAGGKSQVIPSYTMGGDYAFTKEMRTFLAEVVMELFKKQTIDVTVTGETNAPVNTSLTVSLDSDMVITVKPMKLI